MTFCKIISISYVCIQLLYNKYSKKTYVKLTEGFTSKTYVKTIEISFLTRSYSSPIDDGQ